eukprot:4529699-Alexandrium_andersonii.AAC.1
MLPRASPERGSSGMSSVVNGLPRAIPEVGWPREAPRRARPGCRAEEACATESSQGRSSAVSLWVRLGLT